MSRAVVAKDLVVAQARSLKMPGVVRVLESLARQAREVQKPQLKKSTGDDDASPGRKSG